MKLLLILLSLFSMSVWAIDAPDRKLPSTWREGTYVWDSRLLLNPITQKTELALASKQGIKHLYVGLTAEQVANKAMTHQQLRELTRRAWSYDMSVSLLLGEPLWIKPEHRPKLLSIIGDYTDLPLYSLVLDLEVEQLGWPVPTETLTHWIETVKDAKAKSTRPIELVTHWRWFTPEYESDLHTGAALLALGIHNVTMMTFTTNTDRISDIISSSAKHYPSISFRIAQSVEPQLSPEESWASGDKNAVQKIQNLRTHLSGKGFTGIDWQNWEYLKHTEFNN